ncbi:MAG TPA: hypothetical protein V6D20_23505, partial [Candidatus Obscuribacterales bacterium]
KSVLSPESNHVSTNVEIPPFLDSWISPPGCAIYWIVESAGDSAEEDKVLVVMLAVAATAAS